MLEFEYFEKFKALGMYIVYGEMIDAIIELKQLYREEANHGVRSYKETKHILNALEIVEGTAVNRRREALKKC